jgi:hypothetical protein
MEPESKQQELPEEEAAVETIWALEAWYGDRHLAIVRRRHNNERTRANGGYRKNFASARRRTTRSTFPLSRKVHGRR